jgi:hypothetical protein
MTIRPWLTGVLAVALLGTAAWGQGAHDAKPAAAPAAAPAKVRLVEAKPPPFTDGIFPCTSCHTGDFKANKRTLEFHDDVQGEFNHDNENRWCLDCHDAKNRDMLHLTGGALIPFTESYRLCGQCHGDKYRDWKRGVHGKRVGQWNGERTYLLCVNCHNPHTPRFKPIKPLPPPVRPSEMKR